MKNKIHRILGQSAVEEALQYVRRTKPKLWGQKRQPKFLDRSFYLCLKKDMSGKGYGKILKKYKKYYPVTQKSLQYNTRSIRKCLAKWATENHLKLLDRSHWNRAAATTRFTGEFKRVNLWMDSTDFKRRGRKTTSRKGDKWSYKLNGPGRRYMVLSDANRKIRKLWGGYSPKTYDSHFLQAKEEFLEEHLIGAVVIADNHFEWGRTNLQNVEFLVNHKVPADDSAAADLPNVNRLTQEKIKFNDQHQHCRARVESPFGTLAQKFKSLDSPFMEDEKQQDRLVTYAFGFHNASIN